MPTLKVPVSTWVSPNVWAGMALSAKKQKITIAQWVRLACEQKLAIEDHMEEANQPKEFPVPGTMTYPPDAHCNDCDEMSTRPNCDRHRSCYHAYVASQRKRQRYT